MEGIMWIVVVAVLVAALVAAYLFPRLTVLDVRHRAITADGVSVEVEVAVSAKLAPWRARALTRTTRAMIRAVIGQRDLDDVLHDQGLPALLLAAVKPVGVEVQGVEVVAVDVPEEVQTALAAFVIAERLRRARLMNVEAEHQSAARLAEAAEVMKMPVPYLRWLLVLEKIGHADVEVQAAGPTKLPEMPKSDSPLSAKLAAGMAGVREQRRAESWIGAVEE
jgi:hypothetical protein